MTQESEADTNQHATLEETTTADEPSKPSWVAKLGLGVAVISGALTFYQWWNGEANLAINAAIELSTKNIQDSGIENIRRDFVDWFNGKVTNDNKDQKGGAAVTYVLYLEYAAQLINTKRLDERYVSLLLKCELINIYSNLYEKGQRNNALPPIDKVVNLHRYYSEHRDADCRLRSLT